MHRDDLFLEFVRVVERAAIAAARTMGQGDRKYSDQVAVESMRKEMESVDIDGTIVIGEGERDEAPMLYIGEKVGRGGFAVDIAVDPLEGTNLCATGTPNAIAVIAAAEKGGLLNAPDIYMEKLVVGPSCRGKVDLNGPVEANLNAIAKALDREVHDLVVIVLDRPRHERLIADIRKAGARIRLIRGPARADQARRQGAPEEDGDHEPGEGLPHGGPRPRAQHHLRRLRRHGRRPAEGGPLLRRRPAHAHPRDDDRAPPGPLHRHDPRQG